jgi:signal transduction histidine kinase
MAGEEIFPSVELRVLRKDGSTIWIQAFNSTIEYQGRPAILNTSIDITERKLAEEEICRHAARMAVLTEISRVLAVASQDVQAVLDTIVRQAAEVIGDSGTIHLLSSDERSLRVVAFYHVEPEVKALMERLHTTVHLPTSQEWIAHLLRTSQPVFIPIVTQAQLRLSSLHANYVTLYEPVPLHSLLIVPLRVQGRVIGTLTAARNTPGRPYTSDDQVFLQDLADHAALTLYNARLFEQVRDAHEQMRALSHRLLNVQEDERRHLARELHDEIGQTLTGPKLLLDTSTRLPQAMLKSRIDEAQALVDQLMEQVEELSLDLHPPMLDELGLLPTLLAHFDRYTHQTHIQVMFKQNGLDSRHFRPELETTVYRLIQEALTNVARHAGVQEVTVRLWVGHDTLGVEVEDHGVGFDPQATGVSMGLPGMRERAALLGGQLTIESAPGSGTQITAELPLESSPERSYAHDYHPAGG